MSVHVDEILDNSHVSRVAIKYGCVASTNLTWVIEHDDLGVERCGLHGWVILGVRGDVPSANVLNGHILHVETDVVSCV